MIPSDPEHESNGGWQMTRVLFSVAMTAVVAVGAYLTISWLARLHP
jgi:heme/copper-type cytochrome/quinol oxidase subunit 4